MGDGAELWIAALVLVALASCLGPADEAPDPSSGSALRADVAAPSDPGERDAASPQGATPESSPRVAAEACAELAGVLACMKNKALAAERGAIAASRDEVMAQLAKLGAGAEVACGRALAAKARQIDAVGCAAGRDTWSGAERRSYPMGKLKPLADDCATPWVGLASAPRSNGPLFTWPWVRQTLFAHPGFQVVLEAPRQPAEVQLVVVDGGATLTLFARCWDAETCNRLAATVQAVMRTSRPTLSCGELPLAGERLRAFVLPEDGSWLPAEGDWVGACARINACRIALAPETPGNPGLECQGKPAAFDLGCAQRPACRDVVACLAAEPSPRRAP